ncbi:MAG: hypothetical protein ACRDU0_19270, partial [Mycobacterium sp.]
MGAGILILLFVAFQLWGTKLSESASQDTLRQQFNHAQAAARAHRSPNGGDSPPTATNPATFAPGQPVPAIPPPPDGGALGIIEIPKISVNKVMVEGTGTADLRRGPGHYP